MRMLFPVLELEYESFQRRMLDHLGSEVALEAVEAERDEPLKPKPVWQQQSQAPRSAKRERRLHRFKH